MHVTSYYPNQISNYINHVYHFIDVKLEQIGPKLSSNNSYCRIIFLCALKKNGGGGKEGNYNLCEFL